MAKTIKIFKHDHFKTFKRYQNTEKTQGRRHLKIYNYTLISTSYKYEVPSLPYAGGHFSSAANSTSSFRTYSGIVVMTSLCKCLRAQSSFNLIADRVQSSFNRIADRVQSSFNLKADRVQSSFNLIAGRVQSSFNLKAERVQSSFNLKADRHGYTDHHLLVHCHC